MRKKNISKTVLLITIFNKKKIGQITIVVHTDYWFIVKNLREIFPTYVYVKILSRFT